MLIILATIAGLLIGSFLSVCIYRIPLGYPKGLESLDDPEVGPEPLTAERPSCTIISPARSFCPTCGKQLLWWHNIPVLSWIILRGKCHFCSAKISPSYMLVELASAFLAVFSVVKFDLPTAIVVYAFAASLVVLSLIDIEYYILPNVITYPSFLIALALTALNQFFHWFSWPVAPDLISSLWGILAGGGFLFAVSEIYFRLRGKIGLGMGDVKLLAVVGALFGPECAFTTIFLGSFLGAVIGGSLVLLQSGSMKKPLPFGPYLALGTLLFIYLGPGFPHNVIALILNR